MAYNISSTKWMLRMVCYFIRSPIIFLLYPFSFIRQLLTLTKTILTSSKSIQFHVRWLQSMVQEWPSNIDLLRRIELGRFDPNERALPLNGVCDDDWVSVSFSSDWCEYILAYSFGIKFLYNKTFVLIRLKLSKPSSVTLSWQEISSYRKMKPVREIKGWAVCNGCDDAPIVLE